MNQTRIRDCFGFATEESQPTVCCIMLVSGREAMVNRAILSFEAQTYPVALRHLLVYDSGETPVRPFTTWQDSRWRNVSFCRGSQAPYGTLCNAANARTLQSWDILCHFDSDDWSHPRRIEEQVALLQVSGRPAVGYNEMLFWDTRTDPQAWLYSCPNPRALLGTSMCYWRKTWEARPFDDVGDGADYRWWVGLSGLAASSLNVEPRMIASIHGGNMSAAYRPETMAKAEWRRAPEWTEYCREKMKL